MRVILQVEEKIKVKSGVSQVYWRYSLIFLTYNLFLLEL